MEMIEAGQLGMMETGLEDQKMVLPIGAQAMEVVADQPRGVKRRRDRGSTAKERISKMPPCAAGKRSSIYRGVTRHRWTGRYEAHLWDKSTWNQSQNKKGKQVYLGAYDEEEAAARAYDLAALKYWGPGTLINFPVTDYSRDIEEMKNTTREEYLASLRRKSSGFSRGVSKYRGVARHHHNGRWEARIGRVFGNKYLYLGTYSTQEEAAAAYDMAAIEYRGLNAVTNFDLSRYIRWLRPGQGNKIQDAETNLSPNNGAGGDDSQLTGLTDENLGGQEEHTQHPVWPAQSTEPYQLPALGLASSAPQQRSPTALSLLQQSSMFKQMMERASAAEATECDSMSTGPSEVSQEIEQQQQNCNQQHQDTNSFFSTWGKEENVLEQQQAARCQGEDEGSARQDGLSHDNSASFQQSVTSNYQQAMATNYQQSVTSNYQQLDMTSSYQQPVTSNYQQSVPSNYGQTLPSNYDQSVPSNYAQQSLTSSYPGVVGDHYSELQDRKQDLYSDSFPAAYVQGYSHNLLSNLYNTQQNSGLNASIDDGLPNWAFTSALPLSSTLPLSNAISTC